MATVCTNKELAKALHKLAIPETGDASTIVVQRYRNGSRWYQHIR